MPIVLLLAAAVLLQPAAASAIVGGRPADPRDYPWYARTLCGGGSLVAPDRVLTAAHCTVPARVGSPVLLGSGEVRTVSAIATHPAYVANRRLGRHNPEGEAYDVALLVLDRPAKTRPVPLAQGPWRGARTGSVRAIGAGMVKPPPRSSSIVRDVAPRTYQAAPVSADALLARRKVRTADLTALTDARCQAYWRGVPGPYYRRALRPSLMLCAGDSSRTRTVRRSSCSGDSGSPLLVRRGRTWLQVGVTSWGRRCGADRDPTVFADVGAVRDFIRAPTPELALAPRADTTRTTFTGEPRVGATLTCAAGGWTVAPSALTYTWISYSGAAGRVDHRQVQRGPSPAYVVRPFDRGRLVWCEATGYTPGGLDSSRPAEPVRIP